jgi:tetratricopeptide (TPR) repeat protein
MKSVGHFSKLLMYWTILASSAYSAETGPSADVLRIRTILEQSRRTAAAISDSTRKTYILANIAVMQARAGDQPGARVILQEALRGASALKFNRDDASLLIALAQVETGDITGAFQTVATIQEGAYSVAPPPLKEIGLESIAAELAKAGDISRAIRTANSIKAPSRRPQILEAVAIRLARDGAISRALEITASLPSDFSKADSLSAIAAAQAKSGDKAAAEVTFREALKIAKQPGAKFSSLGRIAIAQAEAEMISNAIELASSLPNSSWKPEVIRTIAASQAMTGDVSGALETVARIGDWETARGTSNIALAQARAGDYDGAMRTFQQSIQLAASEGVILQEIIEAQREAARAETGDLVGALEMAAVVQDDPRQTSILEAIAVARSNAGEVPRALQTAASLKSNFLKSRALTAIASAQIKAGDRAAAYATLQQALLSAKPIKGAQAKSIALGRVAVALAEAGRVTQALKLVADLSDNYIKADVLGTLAVDQAKAGNMSSALRIVATISKNPRRAKALGEMAVGQAQVGDTPGALKTVDRIRSDAYEKARALAAIAVIRVKIGDQSGAELYFQQALRIVEGSRDKAPILYAIAIAQTNTGDHPAARATLHKALDALRVQDEVWKAAILRDIAVAQAEAGDVVGALKTASRIADVTAAPGQPRLRLSAYAGIAAAQVEAGDTQGAFQTVAMIQNNPDKADILQGIAQAQATKGDVRAALRTVSSIKDESRNADAVTSIAMIQISSGDLTAALLTTLLIKSGPLSAQILRSIAKAQARDNNIQDDFVGFIDQCPPLLRSSALLGWSEGILERATGQKVHSALSSVSQRISGLREYSSVEPWLIRHRGDALADVQRTIRRESQKVKIPITSPSPWQKVSDEQIARLFFPNEKLCFNPCPDGVLRMDLGTLDGVYVYEINKVVANLDDDPESEFVVLIKYSTGQCTSCSNQLSIGILDGRNETVNIAWSDHAFDHHSQISVVKLFNQDKFLELAIIYDTGPGSVVTNRKIRFLRWTGKQFAEVWSTPIEDYDSGAHEGIPHAFLAKVDFLQDKTETTRVRVTGVYSTPPHVEEWTQYAMHEEFAWNEAAQKYLSVKQIKVADLVELLEVLNAPKNIIESTKKTEESNLERVMGY